MPTVVQFRKGTTSEHSTFTGANGEITVDTDKTTVVVHDASTQGGIPLAKESEVTNIDNTSIATDTIKATKYEDTFTSVSHSTNTFTIDCSTGNMFSCTLEGASTIAFSNVPTTGTGYVCSIKLVQDATGSRGVTWPTGTVWASATAPTLSTTAAAEDMFVLITHDGGTTWYGFTSGIGMA